MDSALIPTTLTDHFCSGTDWVVKVAPSPVFGRYRDRPCRPDADSNRERRSKIPIASQIIGFKVGASTVTLNGSNTTAAAAYCYNASLSVAPCYDNQFNEIRSVRISLIGRTPPKLYTNSNVNSPTLFTNTFDGQPYKIQALSIIVNPRNLSMND